MFYAKYYSEYNVELSTQSFYKFSRNEESALINKIKELNAYYCLLFNEQKKIILIKHKEIDMEELLSK